MAKRINLTKNEAFFEGFNSFLSEEDLELDDNNRLIYIDYNKGERVKYVVDGVPCYTPKATLNALASAAQQYLYRADGFKEYPDYAYVLGYIFNEAGYTLPVTDNKGNNILPRSVNYYEKALSKIFGTVYRYHYKLVCEDDCYFNILDYNVVLPGKNGAEFGGGIYKIEVAGHPEVTTYHTFTGDIESNIDQLAAGTYDMYIYSTLPTLTIDDIDSENCTVTYLESDHLVQYVLTATGAGSAKISGYLGSIVDVQADASVTVSGDADTNLWTLDFDRAGQYIVKLFCNEADEEIRVQEATNCSFGSRTLVW